MEIKRISYNGTASDEVYRWLDHVVEEVVLQYLQADARNYIDLKVSKHIQEGHCTQSGNEQTNRE